MKEFFKWLFTKRPDPEVNCHYQLDTEVDPFRQRKTIIKVLEIKQGWVRYKFYYEDLSLYSHESYGKMSAIKNIYRPYNGPLPSKVEVN